MPPDGQWHFERRHRPARPALRGCGDPRRRRQRAPHCHGRLDDHALAGRRQQADAAHVLPARRAPRQRGHQPHRLRGQARDVPAFPRDRRRRRPEQRRPVRLPLLGAPVARALDLAVGVQLRPGRRLDDLADDVPHLGLGVPVRGLHRPRHLGPRRRAHRSRQRVHALQRRPCSSTARPTRSGCWPRRRPCRPTRAPATCSSGRRENLLRCSPDAATVPATPLTCSSFVAAGVKLDRLIIQQGDGRQALVDRHLVCDRRASPPGRRLLRAPARRQRAGRLVPVGRRLHLLSARLHAEAARPRRRSASSRARRRALADGDVNNPQGAITLQDRPTTLRFRTSAAIWTQYVRTLTPGDADAHLVRLLLGDRAGRPRDADRPGRACARADALPRPEPRRQDARRSPSACCSPGTARSARSSTRPRRCAARTTSSSRATAPPRRWPAAAASRCSSARA